MDGCIDRRMYTGYGSYMTQTAATATRGTFTVTRDGARIGIIRNNGRTFTASRKYGQAGVDVNRVSYGFRTVQSAAAWIGKGAA